MAIITRKLPQSNLSPCYSKSSSIAIYAAGGDLECFMKRSL